MQSEKISLALQLRGIALELRDKALKSKLADLASDIGDTASATSDWHAQNPIESFVPAALNHLEKIVDLIDQWENERRQKGINEWVESKK